MEGRNSLPQTIEMDSRDPFIAGLRQIFAARPDLRPATIAVAAGLDNSTLRKLMAGSNASPRVDTAKRIADAMGYLLSDIIAIGEQQAPSGSIELTERMLRLDPNLLKEALNYALFLKEQQQSLKTPDEDAGGNPQPSQP